MLTETSGRTAGAEGEIRIVVCWVEGLSITLAGSGTARPGRARSDVEDTRRLWRGLLVGVVLSLSGFWTPLGLAAWWWFG